MIAFTRKLMKNKLPPAIPDGVISCREQSFFEIQDRVAQDILPGVLFNISAVLLYLS